LNILLVLIVDGVHWSYAQSTTVKVRFQNSLFCVEWT